MFKKTPKKLLSDKAVDISSKKKPVKADNPKKLDKPKKAVNPTIIKNTIGIVAFLALLIIIFVVIKESMPQTQSYDTYSYNGFDFTGNGVLWQTTIYDGLKDTNYYVQLHNGPREVEDVPVRGDTISLLNRASGFYLTFDPLENDSMEYVALSAYEISSNYHTVYQRPLMAACDKNETNACFDRPIVDCSEPNTPAIYLIAEGPAEVYVDGPCIYVKGEGEELVRAANRLLYQWYGIMK